MTSTLSFSFFFYKKKKSIYTKQSTKLQNNTKSWGKYKQFSLKTWRIYSNGRKKNSLQSSYLFFVLLLYEWRKEKSLEVRMQCGFCRWVEVQRRCGWTAKKIYNRKGKQIVYLNHIALCVVRKCFFFSILWYI